MSAIIQPQGWQQQLGIGPESPWGSKGSLTQWFAGMDRMRYDPGWKHLTRAIGSRGRRRITQRGKRTTGSIEAEVCPGRIDELMDLLIIPNPSTAPNTLNSATIQAIHSPDIVKTYLGCRVNMARFRNEISGDEGGGDLIATMDLIARERSRTEAAGTPNYDDIPAPFTFHELVLTIGQEMEAKRSVEIAFNYMLQADKWGNDQLLRDLESGGQDIDLDLGLDLEDTWALDLYESAEDFAVSAKWTRGANSLEFIFPTCRILEGGDPEAVERGNKELVSPKIAVMEGADGTPEFDIKVDGASILPA